MARVEVEVRVMVPQVIDAMGISFPWPASQNRGQRFPQSQP